MLTVRYSLLIMKSIYSYKKVWKGVGCRKFRKPLGEQGER